MKNIKLNDGKSVIVDDNDYYSLIKYKWTSVSFQTGKVFAKNQKHGLLHKYLLRENPDEVFLVEFKNGNTLDCRRENLVKKDSKIVKTNVEVIKKDVQLGLFGFKNLADEKVTKIISDNSSGVKEKIVFEARYVSPEGRVFNFGTFNSKEEAEKVYEKMVKMIPR